MKEATDFLRNLGLTLILLLSTVVVNAENRNLGKANDAFDRGEYIEALKLYSIVYILDNVATNDKQNLCKKCREIQMQARIYASNHDTAKAADLYQSLLTLNPKDIEANEYLKSYYSDASEYSSKDIEIVKTNDGKQLLCFVDANIGEMTYKEAVEFCKRLNVGGEIGWQLPTMEELMLYYYDFPKQKGTWLWVGYKGVIINNKEPDYYELNTNMRYAPCINGETLLVHPYQVNSRGEYVSGNMVKHRFIPVKLK